MGKRPRNKKNMYIYIFFRGPNPLLALSRESRGGVPQKPQPQHPTPVRERKREQVEPTGGEPGTTDGSGDAPASLATADHALSQGEREGSSERRKEGGNATGLQPSTDGTSMAG